MGDGRPSLQPGLVADECGISAQGLDKERTDAPRQPVLQGRFDVRHHVALLNDPSEQSAHEICCSAIETAYHSVSKATQIGRG